mgnify:CR=1 FL=1
MTRTASADRQRDGFKVVPNYSEAEKGTSGQCTDCYSPPLNHVPTGSAQYGLALTKFNEDGSKHRFRYGFIGSSDNHQAAPGSGYKEIFGLNEIVLHSGSYAQMMRFSVTVDDQLIFEERADGLIISTPTGSTAYSLSAGGSIVHPELNIWNIIPMMSQSLSSRPLIVSNKKSLEIQLIEGPLDHAMVCVDGQKDIPIEYNNSIHISKKDSSLKIIHPSDNCLLYTSPSPRDS